MTNTQIKIRIQLDPSVQRAASDLPDPESEADSNLPADDEQIYDRRKLFLAACILLPALAGLIWLISAVWVTDEIDPQRSLPESSSLSEMPTTAQIEHDTRLSESARLLGAAPTHETDAVTVADVTDMTDIAPPDHEAVLTTREAEIAATPIPQPTPTVKPISSSDNSAELEVDHAFNPHSVTDQVFRAQLTSAISQREPVDDIKQISLAGRSSRPVYLFLHLHNLKNETIRINWFFQEQSIAQVLLPVGNNDWRTYSSKTLNARRLGKWRVTAQDSSGNLLAEFPFEATP
ncbi:MAG: DUF2914 domain-containing protein [Nitrosomonas sp.]|nr:DUF2914 domain-containing protein [Nitrosomonas sp.]MCC7136494.1 DUF2914 domain-containing protein [Nitrosomonas sp.]